MESNTELLVEKDARDVHMSMETMYEALVKAKTLEEKQEKKKEKEDQEKKHCLYHKRSVGHFIQVCQDFLELV